MTNTGICNLALAKISAPPINSLDEPTVVAETLRIHFEACRREILALSSWPFATRRTKPPRMTEAPEFGYTYAFQLPSDHIAVVDAMAEDESRIPAESYVVEGGLLLTDSETCLLRYVREVTDPNSFPPLFVNAFSHLLAARVAPALTGNAQLGILLESQVAGIVAEGSAANQNESFDRLPDYRLYSQSIAARY